jgi:ferredoxin
LKAVDLLASHTKDTGLNLACQLALDGRESIALTALLLAYGKALLSKENRYDDFIGMIVDKLLCSTCTGKMSSEDSNMVATHRDQEEQRSSILKNLEIAILLKEEIQGPLVHQTSDLTSTKNIPPILKAAQVSILNINVFTVHFCYPSQADRFQVCRNVICFIVLKNLMAQM